MPELVRCPNCGSDLPPHAPKGLCPRCLMRQVMDSEALSLAHPAGPGATIALDLGSHGSSVLDSIAASLGSVPRVLLRDTPPGEDPSPVVRPSSPAMPGPGERLEELQLCGEIARGGMGAVLKGRDPDLGRDLAVKVLLETHKDRPELVRRFVEEAQIAGQLQHPGIVPVYELGTFPDHRPYFSMKLVKGRTLAELLAHRNPEADLPRLLTIFEAICQTMAYARARGVIHRDLKPSNVMVGSFGEVQVMDWGLAKVLPRGGVVDDASAGRSDRQDTVIATARSASDADQSQAGSIMGTPSYMAPEQARGDVDQIDERCDVFALGSILCEILTGEPAFTGRSSGEIQRKAARGDLAHSIERIHRCGADTALIALSISCLAPEPADRPRHAGDIAERMSAYRIGVQERLRRAEISSAEEKARAKEATRRAVVERDRRRLTVALAASALGLVMLGGGGWAYLARERAARRAATEKVVTAALDEAILLRGQAKAAGVDDLSKWPDALAAARRADALLATAELGDALRIRVGDLVAALERGPAEATHRGEEAERDSRLLERPAIIELEARDRGSEWAESAYPAAFREFGIDLDKVDPLEAGRFLARRSVPLELAFYLHDWALQYDYFQRGDERDERQSQLIKAANVADPDPWRSNLRKQLVRRDGETLRQIATDEKALSAQPAIGLLLLASILDEGPGFKGVGSMSRQLMQKAWRLQPNSFLVCNTLGSSWHGNSRGEKDLGVRFCTAAVALQPTSALAHDRLAHELIILYQPKSLFEFSPEADSVLDRYRLEEATAELREAVRLGPDVASFHRDLGCALMYTEQADEEAIAEYRKAIRLDPGIDGFLYRHELAYHLFNTGKPNEAAVVMRDYLRCMFDNHLAFGEGVLSEEEADLREFERLAAMEGRLDSILRGQDVPADTRGKLDVARLCRVKRLFAASAQFYREAFAANPALAEDVASRHRLHAAIAAVRAGTPSDRTKHAPRPANDAPYAYWRGLALNWLRADRDACARLFTAPGLPARPAVARDTLDILSHHRDLARVRDKAELEKLPEEERKAWQAFWGEVAELLRKAEKP